MRCIMPGWMWGENVYLLKYFRLQFAPLDKISKQRFEMTRMSTDSAAVAWRNSHLYPIH